MLSVSAAAGGWGGSGRRERVSAERALDLPPEALQVLHSKRPVSLCD